MNKNLVSTSKFLSLILRHKPETIGVELDSEGWLSIDELISQSNAHGRPLTLELIHQVIAENDKQRFALSDDGLFVRANQGHSLESVDLGLKTTVPPETLFHGTVDAFLESIREHGLQKRSRNHVHLSPDVETARKVASRRGKPIALTIAARRMHETGIEFYLSKNGVWLTDAVPAEFIEFPSTT